MIIISGHSDESATTQPKIISDFSNPVNKGGWPMIDDLKYIEAKYIHLSLPNPKNNESLLRLENSLRVEIYVPLHVFRCNLLITSYFGVSCASEPVCWMG